MKGIYLMAAVVPPMCWKQPDPQDDWTKLAHDYGSDARNFHQSLDGDKMGGKTPIPFGGGLSNIIFQ